MSHLNERIIKNKLGLLNLAAELGNISRACKVMGTSRDTFYRYQKAVEEGGIDALIDKNCKKPNLKNRVDEATETAVIAFATDYLTLKELQDDLDEWLHYYNHQCTHQGKMCCGRTPIETLIAGKEIWNDKVDKLNSI